MERKRDAVKELELHIKSLMEGVWGKSTLFSIETNVNEDLLSKFILHLREIVENAPEREYSRHILEWDKDEYFKVVGKDYVRLIVPISILTGKIYGEDCTLSQQEDLCDIIEDLNSIKLCMKFPLFEGEKSLVGHWETIEFSNGAKVFHVEIGGYLMDYIMGGGTDFGKNEINHDKDFYGKEHKTRVTWRK